MRPVYKTQFTLEPLGDRSPREVADEVMATISAWIAGHSREGEPAPAPVPVGEITRDLAMPFQVKCEQLPTGEFHRAIYWAHPDERGAGLWWVTLCDLAYAEGTLELWFTLGVEATDGTPLPRSLTPGRPRIIPNLLGNPHWKCLSAGQNLPLLPWQITAAEVEEISENVLFSPARKDPVVLMTPTTAARVAYPVNPIMLAERLAGTARVLTARDAFAVEILNQYLGAELSCPLNALRVFAPGLDSRDGGERHWCFLGETIRGKKLRPQEFANFLFARLAEQSVSLPAEPGVLGVYRRIFAATHRQRLAETEHVLKIETRAALDLLNDASREIDLLQAQISSLNEQLREREDRILALEHQIASRDATILDLNRRHGEPAVDHAVVRKTGPALRTVPEVVAWAQENCPHLCLLESAVESAAKAPETFKFPERVKAAFEALDKAATDDRHSGWKEYFRAKAFDYKAKISDTTRTRWKDDYMFLYEDRRELFEEHFTLGSGSANTCLSIHFSTRLEPDRIVVAHVGRHLRNTLT